ncbi:MAG: 1-acyl-sn-glycerol-3-phosphate acyltransferase [Proteobacteria bacterium]|nr:1-acyl-sn-glycerol-3-phosphate acyltransferase [Pseudomonadota bacterium]
MKPSVFRWLTVGGASYLGWLVVNIVVAVFFPVFILIEKTGGPAGIRFLRKVLAAVFRIFFLGYFSLIRVYRVAELPDRKLLGSLGPAVFVANHRSWIDPLLIYALIPDVLIPVDISYTKVPLASSVMRWLGAVPFDRHDRETLRNSVVEVQRALREGRPVAAFPEGTRSPVGELGSFSSVFFHAAIEEEVPVQPLVIHLTCPFLGPGTQNFLTAHRAALTIQLLEAVRPIRRERGADLGRQVRKQMARRLAVLDSTDK